MRESRWLVSALLLGLLGYGALLVATTPVPDRARDLVLGPIVLVLPVVLLRRLALLRGDDRAWLMTLAAGAATFPLSRLSDTATELSGWAPLHWATDVLTLAGPVVLLVGLVLAVRQRMTGIRLNVLLDGLAGALAGAAVAALLIAPLVHEAWNGSWGATVLLGRPLLAAALSAAAVGAFGLVGAGRARQFGPWALGLTLLAGSAITDATRVAAGSFVIGTWSDVLPVLALALVALGATFPDAEAKSRVPGARSLGVPATAAVFAVVALTLAPAWHESAVPSVLALSTLAVCAARFLRVFRQLRELAAIREQAMTDELTGIANRRALYQHLDELIDPADGTGKPAEFAVALIDLDHFKEVNDTLGHATGDALLKGVVGRFAAALEELETPHLLARLGGDEFAVVLHEAASRNAALIVGEALHQSLAEPLDLPDTQLHAQASIGLATAPLHGTTRGELLFAADAAMYAAKTSGDAVRFHAPKKDEKSQQLELAEELYRAVERNELTVDYQPIRRIEGEIVAVEALVRWEHPERGRLEPAEFLDAAQRYRLTGAIAERVLDIALGDLASWRVDGVPLTLSLNLSAADLRDETIVSTVAHALLAHRLPAKVLTIDISEAGLMVDVDRIRGVIEALKELGVRLALDDYGTGGTSLESLTALPFDELKLDRSFLRGLTSSLRNQGIVRSTIELTRAFGLLMVAEGVEDKHALALLGELGCDLVQGFHLGYPMNAADFEAELARPTGGKHKMLPDQATYAVQHPAPTQRGDGRRRATGITTSQS
ncbi:MAG: putative bifunctional diguanylate cyclase/phosphodiesterase [Nocardioides sp.]